MEGHYTYLSYPLSSLYSNPELAPYAPDIERFSFGLFLGVVLVVGGTILARRLKSSSGVQSAIVPEGKVTGFSFFDLFVEGAAKYYDSVLGGPNAGDPARKHFPFVFSVFLFLLTANLLGLVPGMPAVTNTVWVNVGMALVVFFYFNAQGLKAHGVGGYLKHFCGPILLLAPFMFVLEIFSICLRVLTLNLRLYWNIKADHVVLSTFTDLLGYVSPVVFYVMGTFVCFMQAFIFSTLTMVYILLASQHDEEHAH